MSTLFLSQSIDEIGINKDDAVDHAIECAHLRFLLSSDPSLVPNIDEAKKSFIDKIKSKNMSEFYLNACSQGLLVKDSKLLETMNAENLTQTRIFEEREKDAAENLGDNEVMEAQLEYANFKGLTGSKEEAFEAYAKVAMRSLSTGQRIDLVLRRIILGFVWMDVDSIKADIEEANTLMEEGGDWDRRNRLKIYNGLFSVISRNFAKASEDFLSGVATFTAAELCTYNTFIFYTVITSVLNLNRVSFKEKIIDSPEVLSVVKEMPYLSEFCNTLYDCDYRGFFAALIKINEHIMTDRYLSAHKDWFMREVRVLAYVQFLESYKSVTIISMAMSFGVSSAFIDKEIAHFISSGRINAKIDKVAGVIESCRPNETNSRYQRIIKQGDLLLNRVQFLSRAINI